MTALRSELSQTEQMVTDAFFRGTPEMFCDGGSFLGGEVALRVRYKNHKQIVKGRTLMDALVNVQRLWDEIHAPTELSTKEAA